MEGDSSDREPLLDLSPRDEGGPTIPDSQKPPRSVRSRSHSMLSGWAVVVTFARTAPWKGMLLATVLLGLGCKFTQVAPSRESETQLHGAGGVTVPSPPPPSIPGDPAALVDPETLSALTKLEARVQEAGHLASKLPDTVAFALTRHKESEIHLIEATLAELEEVIRAMVRFVRPPAIDTMGGREWSVLGFCLEEVVVQCRSLNAFRMADSRLARKVQNIQDRFELLTSETAQAAHDPFARSFRHLVEGGTMMATRWPMEVEVARLFSRHILDSWRALREQSQVPGRRRALRHHRASLLHLAFRPWERRAALLRDIHQVPEARQIMEACLETLTELTELPSTPPDVQDRDNARSALLVVLIRLSLWSLEGPSHQVRLIQETLQLFDELKLAKRLGEEALEEGESLRGASVRAGYIPAPSTGASPR